MSEEQQAEAPAETEVVTEGGDPLLADAAPSVSVLIGYPKSLQHQKLWLNLIQSLNLMLVKKKTT